MVTLIMGPARNELLTAAHERVVELAKRLTPPGQTLVVITWDRYVQVQ